MASIQESIGSQGSGSGEGQALVHPPASLQEAKPVKATKTEEVAVVSDASPELISEIKTAENAVPPKPENIASAVPENGSNIEAKTEVQIEDKVEEKKEVKDDKVVEVTAEKPAVVSQDELINGDSGSSNDNRQQRESALLIKVQELEKLKNEKREDTRTLSMELKVREEEIDLLKARVKNLETELQAALSKPGAKNHEMIEKIKQQHEELLSKARGMIFDQTKVVKNQELQIEALATQVQSLKDINLITKDLLEIRNSEIKAMEDRLHAMEERFRTEKERYGLVLERAQTSSNINDDLKQEYQTQLKIFKELRSKYEEKVEALVTENNKLKLDLAKSSGTGTSTEPPK